MVDNRDVRILTWPEGPATLWHAGEDEQPVRLRFAMDPEPPLGVALRTDDPLDVRMRLDVAGREPVALCIDVGEPICATSDYRVGVDVFDQSVAAVAVRGTTRVERCAGRPEPAEMCRRFDEVETGEAGVPAVRSGEVRLRSLSGGVLRAIRSESPEGVTAVFFPEAGVRVDLPGPCQGVRLGVRNGGSELTVRVLGDGGGRADRTVGATGDAVATIELDEDSVTAVELRGGNNEAGVVEVCYTPRLIG
jgi:hypothetical protein